MVEGVGEAVVYDREYAFRVTTMPDGRKEVLLRAVDRLKVGVCPPGGGGGGKRSEAEQEFRDSINRVRSIRRARQNLRLAIMCIGADRLLTLTFKENLCDVLRARRIFKTFVRLMRLTIPGWQYVVVHEFQKRGAVHFHLAVRGFQKIRYVRKQWLRAIEIDGSEGGNVDIRPPRKRWGGGGGESWSTARLASYLGKYIGKDVGGMEKGARRFIASEDRARPVIERWYQAADMTFADAMMAACRMAGICEGVWMSGDARCFFAFGMGEFDPPPF
jgi:hypothetical protein